MGRTDNIAPHALITGAGRGLGRALAEAFWCNGYNLTLVARSGEALRAVAEHLSPRPGQLVVTAAFDLEDSDSPDRVMAAAREKFTRLDVLINNAGKHGPIGPLESTDPKQWALALHLDLLAPVSLCRLAVPWMKERGRGRIINISGGGATGPRANFTAYAAAKTALLRFGETLAVELAGSGLTVNSVAPGVMKTALLAELSALGSDIVGENELAGAEKAFRQVGDALPLAVRACQFLASEAASGITGKIVSAVWDDYEDWPNHLEELANSDLYTLRRITGRDRGTGWGDK